MAELLVVIGIIVLLVAIVTFVVSKSRRSALNLRVKADFQAITMALEAFKQDHKDYPGIARVPAVPGQNPGNVADSFNTWKHNALALCLMSPGAAAGSGQAMRDPTSGMYYDGAGATNNPNAPGQGFRAVPDGKIWQAYLSTDKFKVVRGAGLDGALNTPDDTMDMLDAFGGPIQYFPRRFSRENKANSTQRQLVAPLSTPPAGGGTDPASLFMFDGRDGASTGKIPGATPRTLGTDPLEIQLILGESDLNGNDINNTIDGTESFDFDGAFLLISWGPDLLPLDLAGLTPGERRKLFDAREKAITLSAGEPRFNDNVYNDE